MAKAAKTKRRGNTLLVLVIAALVVFLGVELVRVNSRLHEAKQQEAALTRQLQQQTQENQALESDLAKKDDKSWYHLHSRKRILSFSSFVANADQR